MWIQRQWKKLKFGLMGTLYVMANDSNTSFKANLIMLTIDFLQMLAFPLSFTSGFPWNESYSQWLVLI
jgi:hypothetical protein